MSYRRLLGRMLVVCAVIAGVTVLALAAQVNAITVSFVYLVAVLLLAAWGGSRAGIVASLAASGCFNFFFLPPTGTFHIAEVENWVALGAFLAAATFASRLVARERAVAAEAESRRREITALYELSLDLFASASTPGGLDAATARALRRIGVLSGGFVPDTAGSVDWVGAPADLETHRLIAESPAPFPQLRIPVEVGGRPVGSLVVYGAGAPRATLEAVARMVGLAVERERLLGERARLRGIEESDAMKTALLRAVSHDLSTPLTAIGLQVEAIRRRLGSDSEGAAAIESLALAAGRLERRIGSLLAMARLEAGLFEPRREPSPAADLFRAAREPFAHLAPARRIEVRVATECPDLDVDPSLIVEVLTNLIENAHRASPPGAPIELAASVDPEDRGRVRLDVNDEGHGLEAAMSAAEGGARRGLGLEIARAFALAHGGSVTLSPRSPRGIRARVQLPATTLVEATP